MYLNTKTPALNKVKIGILNLMPNKRKTEKDLIRVLTNPLINIDLDFIYLETKKEKKSLKKRYKSFSTIKNTYYDGMIITGAPLEHLNYADITFIKELKEFLDYTTKYVKSTLFLCWGAEFALNYFYNVRSFRNDHKLSGLYSHELINKSDLVKGFSDTFLVPTSRYYSIIESDILKNKQLKLICKNNISGPCIIESNRKQIFILGHLEYHKNTLKEEYKRDLKRGLNPKKPENYYFNNRILNNWQSEATLLYHNWLYYFVFKE